MFLWLLIISIMCFSWLFFAAIHLSVSGSHRSLSQAQLLGYLQQSNTLKSWLSLELRPWMRKDLKNGKIGPISLPGTDRLLPSVWWSPAEPAAWWEIDYRGQTSLLLEEGCYPHISSENFCFTKKLTIGYSSIFMIGFFLLPWCQKYSGTSSLHWDSDQRENIRIFFSGLFLPVSPTK